MKKFPPKNSNCLCDATHVARHRFFVPGHAPFLELRTTLDSTLPYESHVHLAFSLGLILQGTTRFCMGNTEYMAQKGDIVLIPQAKTHSCNPVDGPRSYHMLLIDADWLRLHIPDALHVRTPIIRNPKLFCKAESVIEAILADQTDPADHETATSLLTTLFLEICAQYGCREEDGTQNALTVAGLNAICNANDPDDVRDAPRVSSLAWEAGMCRESFSRAVRRKTGLPPSRYLHCLRMEKARRLLRQGKSIAEAALAAGYADQSHFHRMFVRFCAITPGCYRNALTQPYRSHLYKN